MEHLFTPLKVKGLELKNRIIMSPMCQYSVEKKDGIATADWHYPHYVQRAAGGTGFIMIEMTDVEPDGRITDKDLGLWSDEQVPALAKIIEACHSHGAKVGVQIAHAGRKAQDAAEPVAPSAIPFDENSKIPRALSTEEVKEMVEKFRNAAQRAIKAGVDAIEIHGAHGYLIHQFHSPLTNKRNDEYGEERTKFGKEVIQAVKSEMPKDMPLMMRISAKEYVNGGYDIQESIAFAKEYKQAGVDVFDVSSGGEGPIPLLNRPSGNPGYQVPLASEIKKALNVPVIAVGRLENPTLASAVIEHEDADLVAVGRGMLQNPNWGIDAAAELKK